MKKKEDYVRVCPICKSTNVEIDSSNPLIGAAGMPANYVCKNCNYTSAVFPEIKISELKNIKQIPKKEAKNIRSQKVNLAYGKFYIKVIAKIVSILMFIFALFILFSAFNPEICHIETIPGEPIGGFETLKQVNICPPDETRTFDRSGLITGIIYFLLSLLLIYIGYLRKYPKKENSTKHKLNREELKSLKTFEDAQIKKKR